MDTNAGNDYINARATPEAFGSQVGQATSKAGGELQQTGNKAMELAMHLQGMYNESAATNADIELTKQTADMKGKYYSLSGAEAYNAYPAFQSSLAEKQKEIGANLPAGARRTYDMLSARQIANGMTEGALHSARELKNQQVTDGTNLANVQAQLMGDPDVAANQYRTGEAIGSIHHAVGMMVDPDHPGLQKNQDTGEVSFDESTPEGQQLKAQFDQNLQSYVGQGQVNRFTTLAKHDPIGTFDLYKQERDSLPPIARAHLDASLPPQVFDAKVKMGSSDVITTAKQAHFDSLTNPGGGQQSAINTVLRNEGGMSPDGHAIYGIDKEAHPEEFAEAQKITQDKGAAAGQKYANDFYKTEYWDKKGISALPANTQTIVMDGAVNHSTDFSNKLIQAAKDGASPQQLIDMRRSEYLRLADANPEKYGSSLAGWNNRLDNLERQTGSKTGKTFGTNEDGSPLTFADYSRLHPDELMKWSDEKAEREMPGNLEYKRAMRTTVNQIVESAQRNQTAQYTQDNRFVSRAIQGALTNGKPPSTREELLAIPGVKDVYNRVQWQDPKFAEGISRQISEVSRGNVAHNSPNAYSTILRTLQPHDQDHPNSIATQDHLDRLLGQPEGTGINVKDYNDARQAIDVEQTLKDKISDTMQDITRANGNVDGQGEQRAIQWYNQVMAAKKANDALGAKKLPDAEFAASVGEKDGPPAPAPPSRMQQIYNWFSSSKKEQQIPTLTDKTQFDALKSGDIYIRDGVKYRKP